MKKKLAIVSSYNELCGNATYSGALYQGFSKYFDVKIFALPVKLLNNTSKSMQVSSEKIINQYVEELKKYDYVNIQFEKGLYGLRNSDVYNNFIKLASACSRTIVTLHRYDIATSYSNRVSLKYFLDLHFIKGLKELINTFKNNYHACAYEKILTYCEKKKIGIIVHTEREKFLIKSKFDQITISDRPISFLSKEMREKYKVQMNRNAFLTKYSFNENDVVIGIFGFINPYKGHDIAIRALPYLPSHYKLAIFGAQHPSTIQSGVVTNPYIKDLLKLIAKEKLGDRVKFCGALDDDKFIDGLFCCDYNIMPYFETNQSGSGVASLSLETGSKLITSQNYAFIELSKYANNAFKMFSIGNYKELADCILNFKEPLKEGLQTYFEKYNLDTLIQFYIHHFESDCGAKKE